MLFKQFITKGLGCYSYVVGCPLAGVMAVVDPRRDIGVYLETAQEYEMQITHIFETHIHADHVSGAQELKASTGADIYIHESAPVGYSAVKLNEGDEFLLGNTAMRVLHTPGHTPNSVSFLISDLTRSPEPGVILTGDLLFVGDIGRPDLPGDEILDEQVENLHNSLYNTLKKLPDYLEVYPAHGEGSLCGQGMSAKPSSTLGYERMTNPMLNYTDFSAFRQTVLSHLPMRPQSFESIIQTNLTGADIPVKRDPREYALSVEKTIELQKDGAKILDLRDSLSYGAAHIPGSVNVDFTNGPRLNWVGMVLPPGSAIVLVLTSDSDFDKIRLELQRIGYDDVKGRLQGGIAAWLGSGSETQSLKHISATVLNAQLAETDPPALIDVRTPEEFAGASIKGAVNLPIDRILGMDSCPVDLNEEVVVVCQSGFRAGIAAGVLQAKGCEKLSVLSGGMIAWSSRKR